MTDEQARKVRRWKRPDLPEAHQGEGFGWGVGLLVIGFLVALWGGSAPEAGILWIAVGVGAGNLGVLLMCLSLVLREIRRVAFEAAVRAGEVQEVDAPVVRPRSR